MGTPGTSGRSLCCSTSWDIVWDGGRGFLGKASFNQALQGLVEGLTPSVSHWICLVSCYSSCFCWAISVIRGWDQLDRTMSCSL